MQPFEELLGLRHDSKLGQHLYLYLYGLRASLAEALRQNPEDGAAAHAERLLAQLDELLGAPAQKPAARAATRPPKAAKHAAKGSVRAEPPRQAAAATKPAAAPPPEASAAEARKFAGLCAEFSADRQVRSYLGRFEFVGADDAELWQEFQRFLLRLDRQSAESWQQHAEEYARAAGARPSPERVLTLTSGRDELLFPGLEGAVEATGLRLAPGGSHGSVPLDDEAEDVRAFADMTRVCLHFLSTDPHVRHELESVRSYKSGVLSETQKELYSAELLRRFEHFKESKLASPPDPAREVRAALLLGEAILSLVYHPPADPESSWWAGLHKDVRRLVDNSAGAAWKARRQVILTWPFGRFSQIRNYTANSLIVGEGYVPDMVVACLRPHAIIEGRETKGRVLYRE